MNTYQQAEGQHLSNVVTRDSITTNDVDKNVAERRQNVNIGFLQSTCIGRRRFFFATDS